MEYQDGTADEQFTPNWKNSLEARRKTERPWKGKTIFYYLQGHGSVEESEKTEVNDEAFVRLLDAEDTLDREIFGDEYGVQVLFEPEEADCCWTQKMLWTVRYMVQSMKPSA